MTPEKFKRKLTAILSADVKGYSRLIGEDEPLGKEFCKYGFVSGMIPYQTGVATARYAFQNLGKSWMILTQDYRFGHDELAAWLVTSEKLGGKLLGNIYSPLGTVDYSAHIPRIAATNPEILVLNLYGQSLDAAVKQLGEAGLTNGKMKFILPKSHLYVIKAVGATYNENFYGGHEFYWTMQEKFPKAKKICGNIFQEARYTSLSGCRRRIYGYTVDIRSHEYCQDYNGC